MDGPLLSVLFLLPYGFEPIRGTLECLTRQSLAHGFEIVCVLPQERSNETAPDVTEKFHSVVTVKTAVLEETGPGFAVGVAACRAPIVVVGEDHSFPEPQWAERLLARHEEGWVAVAPAMRNANPGTAVSWASYLINFGMAAENPEGGPAKYLPSHQTSYKKDVLLQFEPAELASLLSMEARLHEELARRGGRLYLEPLACTRHYNVEPWFTFLLEQSQAPRQYAALRAAGWSGPRRLLYALAAPLIWVRRMLRTLPRVFQLPSLPRHLLLPTCLAIGVGLAVATVAEASAYVLGMGQAGRRRFPLEFRRHLQVRTSEVLP